MKPSPAVSVVLPVRNAAATLGEAIASIRRQTFAGWELIVVDDGSSDASTAQARDAAIFCAPRDRRTVRCLF